MIYVIWGIINILTSDSEQQLPSVCFLKEFLVLLFCRGCDLDFVYRWFLLRLVQDIGHVLRVWILFCLFKTVHIICPPFRAKAVHLRVLRASKMKLTTVWFLLVLGPLPHRWLLCGASRSSWRPSDLASRWFWRSICLVLIIFGHHLRLFGWTLNTLLDRAWLLVFHLHTNLQVFLRGSWPSLLQGLNPHLSSLVVLLWLFLVEYYNLCLVTDAWDVIQWVGGTWLSELATILFINFRRT